MHTRTLALALLLALTLASVACQRNTPAQTRTVTFEAAASPTKEVRYCAGFTKQGVRCRKHVKAEGDYCWMHRDQRKP